MCKFVIYLIFPILISGKIIGLSTEITDKIIATRSIISNPIKGLINKFKEFVGIQSDVFQSNSAKSKINDLDFFFRNPTDIPNDAEKLKKIGNFCLTTKQKDENCDQMLNRLKATFKLCEHAPRTDKKCQSFKNLFCTAFSRFACCLDLKLLEGLSRKNV